MNNIQLNALMHGFAEKTAELLETSFMYPKGTNPKEIEDYEAKRISAMRKGLPIGAGIGVGTSIGASAYGMRLHPRARSWKERIALVGLASLFGAIPGAIAGGAIGAFKHKQPQHLKPIGREKFRVISDSTPMGTTYKNTPKGLKRIEVSRL